MKSTILRSSLVLSLILSTICILVVNTQPMSREDQEVNNNPQSLPPDTFRQLAQALKNRDDKETHRLERKFLYNTSVTCNDGSRAGYYIRRNYQSKRWIVFLEGGMICHNEQSCNERMAREAYLMSSNNWSPEKSVGGILSADPEENPYYSDANHVFVPYCSSDSWSGTKKGHSGNLAFMGRNIISEVIKELSSYQGLLFGQELFLAGSSAGAIGVLLNVDFVAESVKPNLAVRGIVDSGWFLDNADNSNRFLHDLKDGIKLWEANVNDDCARNYPNELWQCYLGYKVHPFIKSPLFIFQWQFDHFQLHAENVAVPTSPDPAQWNFIHTIGANLRKSFKDIDAVFSPACIEHTAITKEEWIEVEVDGVSLPDALFCWSSSLPDAVNANLGISAGRIIPSSSLDLTDNTRKRAMFKDDPDISTNKRHEPKYKLASNLVRSINTDNSLMLRPHKNRLIHRPVQDNRTGSYGNGGNNAKKRKLRRKLQKLMEKCNEGHQKACNRLRRERSNNGNLVRSLDRRSSANKNSGQSGSGNRNRRKLTKKERKERRKQRKLAKRQRRRLLRIQRKQKKQSKQNKRRQTRSLPTQKQCRTKYIDSGDCPHCSSTCPMLKHPETGQEMNCLSLLQSFGMKMPALAKGIGADINTLNNMDKDALCKLLTSNSQSSYNRKRR